MLTLQPRQRVGHDILLARHGDNISSMRVDRANDRVIATLDDGSWDSAPNLISPLLQMPDSAASLLRDDWRIFTVAGIAMLTIGAIAMSLAMGLAGSMPTEELNALLLSYPAF
ncbi:hypothetical protein [Arthrobacter sp. CJ23]|uniref:hypothetical protein n=1 Tax=Arthrobacter sp. CJ23 TaxID=2972479 RepID=UPI00215BE19E|nr:hypothetical protein [Arthrobacter sp. CJ23]UVJ39436.1 hypothetical protein NVV90_19935 [Arthrobacter sp. CJ23]